MVGPGPRPPGAWVKVYLQWDLGNCLLTHEGFCSVCLQFQCRASQYGYRGATSWTDLKFKRATYMIEVSGTFAAAMSFRDFPMVRGWHARDSLIVQPRKRTLPGGGGDEHHDADEVTACVCMTAGSNCVCLASEYL